jgi:protein disulfide-isomerase A6
VFGSPSELILLQKADTPTYCFCLCLFAAPDNFDKLVNGAKHALIEFYAPW